MTKAAEQAISVLFKQVPGGYVFRAPNPRVFGRSDHYLVNEAQRDEIVAIMTPTRSTRRLVAWIVLFVLAVAAAAISLLVMIPDYPVTLSVVLLAVVLLLSILALHLTASRALRRLQSVLAGAARTDQRITNADMRQTAAKHLSHRQLLYSGFTSAFACVVSLATVAIQIYFRKHNVSIFAEPLWLIFVFNAIIFGFTAARNLSAAFQTAESADASGPAPDSIFRRISGHLISACALALLVFLATTAWVGVKREFSEQRQGQRYEANGDHENAIASFSKVIAADPNNIDVYLDRAKSYTAKGDHDRAIADYTKAIEIDGGESVVYRKRADAYRARGMPDKAITDYSKAIEIDPTDALAYYFRAVSYEATKSSDRAIADVTKSIELNPTDVYAYVLRARNFEITGNHDRATADFNKAIEINPKHYYAYIFRGDALNAKGQHDQAVADYTKAIEIDPKNAAAYRRRAASYARLGSTDLAIADYKTILERPVVTPSDREAQDYARQRIDQLTVKPRSPGGASANPSR